MKTKGFTFKKFYLAYVLLLVIGMIAALMYVSSILRKYEETLPECYVKEAMETLTEEASAGTLWNNYNLPPVEPGELEKHLNIQEAYLDLYKNGELTFSQNNSASTEDELCYHIENNGVTLAEVKLKAKGPAVTKLILLTYREWEIASITPLLEAKDYTLTVPADFTVLVNGIAPQPDAPAASTESEVTYTLKNIWLEPAFVIKDQEGNAVNYALKDNKVLAEFYNFTLTLPSALTVQVNGEAFTGEVLDDSRTFYHVRSLTNPEVVIADAYGNEFTYKGGNKLPLTYKTITVDSRYTVEVSGKAISADAVTTSVNPEYTQLTDYVTDLPQVNVCQVAILEDNAEIVIKDENGSPVAYDTDAVKINVPTKGLESVPADIAAEVDVLNLAQQWSLFMSADKPFKELEPVLLKDSYQYKMAKRYATGVDITFTSDHILLDPAFTENTVENFVRLADNCFFVDISFVKHMYLVKTHANVDDVMNDRFYFVKYDDTNDNIDNPTWKIASMKEIVNNE